MRNDAQSCCTIMRGGKYIAIYIIQERKSRDYIIKYSSCTAAYAGNTDIEYSNSAFKHPFKWPEWPLGGII
jgi:hypothetical protein